MLRGPVTVFAPAKINLYLHVTGKRDDGYHLLDSLIVFADIGDTLVIEPSDQFRLALRGPYADAFAAKDCDSSAASGNLVVRAIRALAQATGREPNIQVTLTKNLPLASGIGGGSADAAAALWGVMSLWNLAMNASPFLPDLMRGLGTEVSACLRCIPVRVQGIGDILDPVLSLPELPIVLVNAGRLCPTPEIFRRFKGPMQAALDWPVDLSTPENLIDFVQRQSNDLSAAACEVVPEIAACLMTLQSRAGCSLARMSGSGATVFGLFDTPQQAADALEAIARDHPDWWVQAGTINSPQRY